MTQNNIPKTMRAAVIEQFGGVEQIKIKEVPVPKPGADEGPDSYRGRRRWCVGCLGASGRFRADV